MLQVSELSSNFGRVVSRVTRVDVYRCLTLASSAPGAADELASRIEIRAVERPELAASSRDARQEISTRFLATLEGRRDLCLGAFHCGELVSYCFFAGEATPIDSHLRFCFPPGWIYVYKAFTRTEWRGRGLLGALLRYSRQWHRLSPQHGFVTLALTRNQPSLQAFRKAGFRRVADLRVLILASQLRIVFPANAPIGFRIKVD